MKIACAGNARGNRTKRKITRANGKRKNTKHKHIQEIMKKNKNET